MALFDKTAEECHEIRWEGVWRWHAAKGHILNTNPEVIASVHGMDVDPNENQFLADLIRFFEKVVCFSHHTLTNRILDYRFDCIKGGCWALRDVCAFLSALSGLEVSVNT